MAIGEYLFGFDISATDEVAPTLAFRFQVGWEAVGRAADDIDRGGIELGTDLGVVQNLMRRDGEPRDDRRRRARRGEEAEIVGGVIAGETTLGEGRHVGS